MMPKISQTCLALFVGTLCLAYPALAHAHRQTLNLAGIVAPPIPSDDPKTAEARQGIDLGNRNWEKAWTTGDAALLAAQFAPDGAQFGQHGKVTRGRAAIFKRMQTVMKEDGPAQSVQVHTVEVWMLDGLAYETGTFVYTYPPDPQDKADNPQPQTVSGRYLTIWQKQKDGQWKIHADMAIPKD